MRVKGTSVLCDREVISYQGSLGSNPNSRAHDDIGFDHLVGDMERSRFAERFLQCGNRICCLPFECDSSNE